MGKLFSFFVSPRATICNPSTLMATTTPDGGCGGATCKSEMSPSSGTKAPSASTQAGDASMAAAKGLTSEANRFAPAPPSPNWAKREPSALHIGLSRGWPVTTNFYRAVHRWQSGLYARTSATTLESAVARFKGGGRRKPLEGGLAPVVGAAA